LWIACWAALAMAAQAFAGAPPGLEYEGPLNSGADLGQVSAHFSTWAQRHKMVMETNAGQGRRGLRILPHPAGLGVPIAVDEQGRVEGSAPTAALGPGYHEAAVEVLRELQARFCPGLRVKDFTGFWESRDRKALETAMTRYMAGEIEKTLRQWPADSSARLETPLGRLDRRTVEAWLTSLRQADKQVGWWVWWGPGRDGGYWTQMGCAIYFQRILSPGQKAPDAPQALRTARTCFDRGRAQWVETWLSRYYQGLMARDEGRTDAALVWLRKAAEISPDQPDIMAATGGVLLSEGRAVEAEKVFAALAKACPDEAEPRLRLAVARSVLGRHDDALADLDSALRLEPDLASAWAQKGATLRELGRDAEALAALDKAVGLDPGNAAAWYTRGRTLTALDRPAEAEQSLRKALAIEPGSYDAKLELGRAQLGQGRMDEASAAFRAAAALAPARPEAHYNLGVVYERLGLEAEARKAFDEAAKRGMARD